MSEKAKETHKSYCDYLIAKAKRKGKGDVK